MYQNLHCHTKISDGQFNYKQTLDLCQKYNISIVAFTDHDALPDKKAIKILEKNRNHSTKWIIGCEISSGWPKEIGGPGINFHIIGLFIDPFNQAFREYCQKAIQARIERTEKIVKNLKNLGFKISIKDCLKESNGESIGRPHIVVALKRKEKNFKIIKEIENKMQNEAKHNLIIKQKYDKMKTKNGRQYIYDLFLSPEAFLPDIYVNYLYWKDMDESVKLIRGAGGKAILAHWSYFKKEVDKKMIEKFFQQKRLDGAEIIFGIHQGDDLKEDMKIIEGLTEKYNLLQSGGIDSHQKEDFEKFIKEKWFAKKTIGLVQKMAKKTNLNFKFSSIK